MKKYEFRLVLKGPGELTEDVGESLFEAGCDDGTPGATGGIVFVDFHREANSLEEAIRHAMANVRGAGYNVERVEIEAGAVPQRV